MAPNAEWTIPAASASSNRSLYYYEGSSVEVEGQSAAAGHQIMLNAGEPTTIINGSEPSRILMLQGKPLQEPVAKYGPFVMNTNQEIQEAVQDYQRTQFGGWPWPTHEHTHDKTRGRFALHADGRLEEK